MSDRIVTDSNGDRWDVTEPGTQGDGTRAEGPIRFRHQSGEEFEARSERAMDELSGDELLDLLDAAREAKGLDSVHEGGDNVGRDPVDYVTG